MRYLQTNFTSASSTLTPTPFDSTTEGDSTVTFRRHATHGYNGTPGAKVAWTGTPTSVVGYGTKRLDSIISQSALNAANAVANRIPQPTQYRFSAKIGFGGVTATTTEFNNNDEVKLIRFMYDPGNGVETELCSLSWIKTASSYKWKLSESLGSTTATGGTFNPLSGVNYADTWGWVIDIITTPGVSFIQIGPAWPYSHSVPASGTTANDRLQLAFPETSIIPRITRVDVGAISGSIPKAATYFVYDDMKFDDNLFPDAGLIGTGRRRGELASHDLMWSSDIDNAMVSLEFLNGAGYFGEFGAIGPTSLNPYLVIPMNNLAIEPGATYEIAATFKYQLPVQYEGRGYTSIHSHRHSTEEWTWETPPYYGMHQTIKPRTFYTVGPDHNALRLYCGEFIGAEYYIRRVRNLPN